MTETIGRTRIRDQVAGRLKSYITEGNLQPGDRLPTETELASRFGVSRLSLREATKSLEFLGIVEAKPGRGLSVGQVNMDRVTEYLGFHPALHNVSASILIDTRIVLEAGVLPHAAARMAENRSLYEDLNGINDQLRQTRDAREWVDLDIAFHRGLIAASGLTPLLAFGDLLGVFFRRFRESVVKGQWAEGVASHQRIIEALKAGQVNEADREVREHIESHRKSPEASR